MLLILRSRSRCRSSLMAGPPNEYESEAGAGHRVVKRLNGRVAAEPPMVMH